VPFAGRSGDRLTRLPLSDEPGTPEDHVQRAQCRSLPLGGNAPARQGWCGRSVATPASGFGKSQLESDPNQQGRAAIMMMIRSKVRRRHVQRQPKLDEHSLLSHDHL
jgi:hypothetical protein